MWKTRHSDNNLDIIAESRLCEGNVAFRGSDEDGDKEEAEGDQIRRLDKWF